MIDIIKFPADLKPIATHWDGLARPFRTPLLHYDWFSSCAEALYRPGALRVIACSDNGEITAIAPLVSVKRHGTVRWELLGESLLFETSGLLYRDEQALRTLLDAILRMGNPLCLARLKADAPEVRLLRQAGRAKTLFSPAAGSPFLAIDRTWGAFEAGMSSDNRNELRRKKRALEGRRKITVEIMAPRPDAWHDGVREFMRVESAGWKGRERTALLFDEHRKTFFELYAAAAARRGVLRICMLRAEDQAIAAALAVEDYDRFWLLKIGYDEQWTRCAPGILLVHETLRYAFQRGLEAYEFLGDEAPWIRRWTKQAHPCVRARVYPNRFWGLRLALDTSTSTFMRALASIGAIGGERTGAKNDRPTAR